MENMHFRFPFAVFVIVVLAIAGVLVVGSGLAIWGVWSEGAASCQVDKSACKGGLELAEIGGEVLTPLATIAAIILEFIRRRLR